MVCGLGGAGGLLSCLCTGQHAVRFSRRLHSALPVSSSVPAVPCFHAQVGQRRSCPRPGDDHRGNGGPSGGQAVGLLGRGGRRVDAAIESADPAGPIGGAGRSFSPGRGRRSGARGVGRSIQERGPAAPPLHHPRIPRPRLLRRFFRTAGTRPACLAAALDAGNGGAAPASCPGAPALAASSSPWGGIWPDSWFPRPCPGCGSIRCSA